MTWQDENGNRLDVGSAGLVITGRGGMQAGFYPAPGELEEICAAACQAAGTLPPVMIGRPDLGGERWWAHKGLRADRIPGALTVTAGRGEETLTLPFARQFGAAVVALADLPDDPESDAVENLAALLRKRHEAWSDGSWDSYEDDARAILAAGWTRGGSRG